MRSWSVVIVFSCLVVPGYNTWHGKRCLETIVQRENRKTLHSRGAVDGRALDRNTQYPYERCKLGVWGWQKAHYRPLWLEESRQWSQIHSLQTNQRAEDPVFRRPWWGWYRAGLRFAPSAPLHTRLQVSNRGMATGPVENRPTNMLDRD